jgi:hypothetical protein
MPKGAAEVVAAEPEAVVQVAEPEPEEPDRALVPAQREQAPVQGVPLEAAATRVGVVPVEAAGPPLIAAGPPLIT